MKNKFLLLALISILSATFAQTSTAQTRLRGMTLSPDVSEEDIQDLSHYKVNLVRYQLAWTGPVDTASVSEYNIWFESALDRFESLLPIFEAYGIKVVLDVHTPVGGLSIRQTPHQYRLFSEKEFQDAFIGHWDTIAARFLGNQTIWAYDILNEPALRSVAPGVKDWNALALEISTRIRAIDTLHKIIIEPIYGDQGRLGALKPIPLSGIVYSPHSYYPKKFREQGFGGKKINVTYPKGQFNKAGIQKSVARLISFAKKNKAEIYIGEFTAPRWAPGKSAVRFLKDSIDIFEKQKWHWTYHAWREDDAWSVEHGPVQSDHNVSPVETDRAKLLKKYFQRNVF